MSLSGKCLFQNNSNINLFQQTHHLTTISSSIVFLKHTVLRKCEYKQRRELREDRVINKYYNWWWIGGIQSFLCCEHPVCSPLCVHTRSREAPANRWYAQGMSGMQVHESLHNSSRPGLLTYCPVKEYEGRPKKKGDKSEPELCGSTSFELNFVRTCCLGGLSLRDGEMVIMKIKRNKNQKKIHMKQSWEVPLCFSRISSTWNITVKKTEVKVSRNH